MIKIVSLAIAILVLAGASSVYASAELVSCGSYGQGLQACEGATADGDYCLNPAGAAPSIETIGKCKYRVEAGNALPQCQCVVNQPASRNTPLIS